MKTIQVLKNQWHWGKWAISLILLVLIFYQINYDKFVESVKLVTWWFYPLSFSIFVLTQCIATFRWRIFLPKHSFNELFRLILMSNFYAFLLPSALTGDVAKVVKIKKEKSGSTSVVASVFLDRAFGFVAMLLLMVLGFELCSVQEFEKYKSVNVVLIVCSILSLIILRYFQRIACLWAYCPKNSKKHVQLYKKWRTLTSILQESSIMLTRNRILWVSLLGAFGFQLVLATSYLVLDYLFGWGLNIFDYILISGLTQITMLLPISVGGVGLRDVSFVALLVIAGIDRESAVAGMTLGYPIRIFIVFLGYILTLSKSSTLKP